MKILVACEESQRVTFQFRQMGHDAYSSDILPCSGGFPQWHILGDCIPLLDGNVAFITMDGVQHTINEQWDIIIAHPPCHKLSNAGARHLYRGGELNVDRYEDGIRAAQFFMTIYNARCERIAIENPLPSKIFNLPLPTCSTQPYYHGEPYKKRTYFWLKGLPELMPTEIIPVNECQSTRVPGNWFNSGGRAARTINRSKTFVGIAKAMAEQWGKCDV